MACFRDLFYQVSACILLALVSNALSESTKISPVPLPYVGYDHARQQSQEPSQSLEQEEPSQGPYRHISVPEGYQMQSGYEGYLVPATEEEYGLSHVKPSLGMMSTIYSHVEPMFSHVGAFLPKIGIVALGLVVLLAVGTLLTSCVCAYTPLCHMTFMGVNLTPERFRSLMTQDRVTELASFVQSAIKKYQDMNSKKSIEHPTDSNEVK